MVEDYFKIFRKIDILATNLKSNTNCGANCNKSNNNSVSPTIEK